MFLRNKVFYLIMAAVLILIIIFAASGCTEQGSMVGKTHEAEEKGQKNGIPEQSAAAQQQESETQEQSAATLKQGPGTQGQGTEKVAAFLAQAEGSSRVNIPFEATRYTASVPAYSIETDLSNIANLDQFGSFTEKQKEMLAKNGFVVTPRNEEQLFYIYENNEYLKIPSFITVDSVLQVYHVFYDFSLRRLESDTLAAQLTDFTDNMFRKSLKIYESLKNENLKELQLKNSAYFGVAKLVLGKNLPTDTPKEIKQLALKEYKLVEGQKGYEKSAVFPFELDYSQYTPRGHYTRNDELERYFKAMMWYGQVPFPAYLGSGERNEEQTLQALLMTYTLLSEDTKDFTLWQSIYEPTSFYVGKSDDLNVLDYSKLLVEVYGESPDANHLDDREKLDRLYEAIDKLPEPAIVPKYTTVSTPSGKQFRLMGQRYVADSEILQELVEPYKRPVPMGLDVMAVLGSKRAESLLFKIYGEDKKWEGYTAAFNRMKKKFDGLEESKWQSNMYFGWLWSLKGLLKEYGEGYPYFMQTEAWQDKSLSTALGSWSELKHDTVLYGKGIAAECGGGEEPPQVKGYVEPNIEVYEKLLWLTRYSRENLKKRGILGGEMESKMENFEHLLTFLINCSIKELRNEELSKDEYYQLLVYGGWLESLTCSLLEGVNHWFANTSEADRNMAVISDIHTVVGGGVLEVGVGPAYEIFVVVPIGGKLYITRGAVFSYFEFMSDKRLTDEEWQQLHKKGKHPEQPEWIRSFMDIEPKTDMPTPAEPYISGC